MVVTGDAPSICARGISEPVTCTACNFFGVLGVVVPCWPLSVDWLLVDVLLEGAGDVVSCASACAIEQASSDNANAHTHGFFIETYSPT
jgi:hypothetical protein